MPIVHLSGSEAAKPSRHSALPRMLADAVSAHEAGRLSRAARLYRRFLEQKPQNPTALQLLGMLHSQRGEHATAVELMRESLRLFPQQAEVANNLGNALSRCGRLDEAIASYREATRIKPRYADAWRNLGLTQLAVDRSDEAIEAFRHCLDISPEDAAAMVGMGSARKRRNEIDSAMSCFEAALALRPDYPEAHHNLGTCLRIRQRPRDALRHYAVARRLGLDDAALHHNRGNALADTGDRRNAIQAYRAAIERNPADLDSHQNLNSLLWQQDLLDEYLQSYKTALRQYPGAEHLRLAYAMALNQWEAFADAEQVLVQGLAASPASAEMKSLLAWTLENQGRWEEALRSHAAAVALPGASPHIRVSYARALLACQRADEALPEATAAAARMPFNQRALAYLSLCWRLLGDPRDALLNDYRNLVKTYDVPVPERFGSSAEWNERLGRVLDALHVGKRHPAEQTLRGGTQTSGDLFLRPEPEIRELVGALTACIEDYIAALPWHAEHPLLVRRGRGFNFAGSWSVRLRRCGYHTMHVHPLGWISSAYYVQVPREMADGAEAGGGLKFGEPDIDIGAEGRARRTVKPEVGRLVLFPSYMWHGTVPFEQGDSRMTVAFDVVPAGTPPPRAGDLVGDGPGR